MALCKLIPFNLFRSLLNIQGVFKKALWSKLQPTWNNKLRILCYILFLYLYRHNLCLANFYFQATEKVLRVSKKSQKAWSKNQQEKKSPIIITYI